MKKIMLLILFLGMLSLLMGAGSSSSSNKSDSSPTVEDDSNYIAAKKAVEAQDYQKAIAFLEKAEKAFPENADIFNLLGYSYRKMGKFEISLEHYTRALKINPKHRGAHEYLGELYLTKGELAKAEEHLKVLDGDCIFGCEEYDDLKEAVEAYKKKHGLQ